MLDLHIGVGVGGLWFSSRGLLGIQEVPGSSHAISSGEDQVEGMGKILGNNSHAEWTRLSLTWVGQRQLHEMLWCCHVWSLVDFREPR